MYSGFVKRFAASLVVLSLWAGAVAILPVSGFGQDAKKEPAKQDTKNKKQAKPEATPAGPAALSVKDDPAQIGKRKINKGTDKFFGWLGGSQQEEMRIGRQLAMEIEQQVKLIDDPVV